MTGETPYFDLVRTALRAANDRSWMVMMGNPAAEAERAIIATILADPPRLAPLRLVLDVSDFYDARHVLLWRVACDLADSGVAPDPAAVVGELARRRKLDGFGNGNYVASLYSFGLTAGDVNWHVARLREAARVRMVEQTWHRIGQLLEQWETTGGDFDPWMDAIAKQALALSVVIEDDDLSGHVAGVQTWEEFTATTDRPRWIVPGLLRMADTVLILGTAGVGKSWLSRQIAMCLAAGVHPFTLVPIEPVRTLLVDLENAPDQVAEDAGHQLAGVRQLGNTGGRGFIWPHPEGFNLRRPAHARLLERAIVETQPQVLLMGSLYNAYRRGRDDWDTAAEDVQAVLKMLRTKYRLALWLEHHMPRDAAGHTGKPYGGTAWERWPTHGRWLRREGDAYVLAATFRGDRGAREIPLGLVRGGKLSWTAVWDQDELDFLTGESDHQRQRKNGYERV